MSLKNNLFFLTIFAGNATLLSCVDAYAINCAAGTYLPANSSACATCPKGGEYYCPGGNFGQAGRNQGLQNCPPIDLGGSTIMTTFPTEWHPNENLKVVRLRYSWWFEGHKSAADCRVAYDVTNNRGVLVNESVQFNNATKKYDKVDNNQNYYLQLNPGYYGHKQFYNASHECWHAKELVQEYKSPWHMIYKEALPCPEGSICPGFVRANPQTEAMPNCADPHYNYALEDFGIYKPMIVSAGRYLPANATSASASEKCPVQSYCPGGSFGILDEVQGRKDCPAISKNSGAVMTSFPSHWYPNEGPIEVIDAYIQNWTTGWQSIADCQAVYRIKNKRGVLQNEHVGYNPTTGKYDNVSTFYNYYLQINPGYYGKEQFYDMNSACAQGKATNSAGVSIHMIYREAIECPAGQTCDGFYNANPNYNAMPSCTDKNYDYKRNVIGIPANVEPGQYLPANSMDPQPCKGSKYGDTYYCPGGVYGKSTVDQGVFLCPFGATRNANASACKLVLSNSNLLMYGPNTISSKKLYTQKCWAETDAEEYRRCVLGIIKQTSK